MAEKTLNTRILLKYDTLANWMQDKITLKAGEMAIATIESAANGSTGMTPPAVGIKIGDGTTKFSALPWIQAVAGDVPSWAKESDWATVKNAYNAAIAKAISDLSSSGDLKTLSNKVDGIAAGGTKAVGVTELITGITMKDGKVDSYTTTPITTDMITAGSGTLTARLTGIDTAITNAISTAASDAATKANAAKEAAITAAAADAASKADTAKSEAIAAAKTETESQVGTLASSLRGGASTDVTLATLKKAAEDAQTAANNASTKVDTEIGKLDYTDTAKTDEFVTAVSETNGIISVSRAAVTSALGIADGYNKSSNKIATVATVTAAVNSAKDSIMADIGEISGAMRFRGTINGAPSASTAAPEDGMGAFRAGDVLVDSSNTKEYIYTGSAWEELGTEGIYVLESTYNTKMTALDGSISDHGTRIGSLETDNTANKTAIGTLQTNSATKAELSSAVDGLKNNEIKALQTATGTTLPNAISTAKTEAQNYAKGLVEALDVSTSTGTGTFVSGVTQTDGKIAVVKSNITLSHITDLAYASASSANTAIAQKSYVDSTVSSAIDNANISGKITSAINGLDSSVFATAESGNQVSVLTGVTQTDGKLASKTEVKLAAIAKTGNVNDLIQTTGDVLIFDCGGAGV